MPGPLKSFRQKLSKLRARPHLILTMEAPTNDIPMTVVYTYIIITQATFNCVQMMYDKHPFLDDTKNE